MNLARLQRNIREGLGAPLTAALGREEVTDVRITSAGRALARERGKWVLLEGFYTPGRVQSLLRDIAFANDLPITREQPILHAKLRLDPDNDDSPLLRIEGYQEPATEAPGLTIRRHAGRVFSVADFCHEDVSAEPLIGKLFGRMRASRKSVLFVGGIGSGKTALLTTYLGGIFEADPMASLVTLEEPREIHVGEEYPNVERFEAHSLFAPFDVLLSTILRCAPEWIVIGEAQRPEQALTYLRSARMGHPTATTVHVETAAEALDRLVDMTVELGGREQQQLWVSQVVAWVVRVASVHCERPPAICEVLEVKGFEAGRRAFAFKTHYELEF